MNETVLALGALDSRWLLVIFLGAVDLWAIALIVASPASIRDRVLWSVVVLLCPIVGCMLWYVVGPKPRLARPREREEERAG